MDQGSAQEKWIPYELTGEEAPEEKKLTWILRGDWRFMEPFMKDSVARNAKNGPSKITDIDELLRFFGDSTAVDPAGFIFHLSRCGSTNVSQMLARDPRNMVLSEPGAAESVLGLTDSLPKSLAHFIGAMKAFSAARISPEQRIFVKFSGSDAWLGWMKMAYPRTPWIFIYRDPAEVLRSNLVRPARWIDRTPVEKRRDVLLGKFEHQMHLALENADKASLLVNYQEITPDFPSRLLDAFGLESDANLIHEMKESLNWYSKNPKVKWDDWQKRDAQQIYPKEYDFSIPASVQSLYSSLEAKRLSLL